MTSSNTFKNFTNSISKSLPKSLPKSFSSDTEKIMNKTSKTVSTLKKSFLENITIILVIFFLLLIITIFLSVFGVSFKETTLIKDKSYILEGLESKHKDIPAEPVEKLGPRELAKIHSIKKKCKEKVRSKICAENKNIKSCGDYPCCAWMNYKKGGAKCEPGSASGPEKFKYGKDGELGYDHYYYKNKKYNA